MELLHPVWLVLWIPAGLSLWLWRAPARGLTLLRAAGYLLVILALCGVAMNLPSRTGIVVVVADRSLSMPPDGPARQSEVVALLQKSLPADNRLAVVSFAQNAAVDKSPFENSFSGFAHQIDGNGSRLADAMDLALGLIGPDQPGRILVLSDGHHTGRSVAGSAARAAARQIAIDYRLLQRPAGSDLAIERVETPRRVAPGQSYLLHAFVRSPIGQEIRYELLCQGQRLTAGTSTVSAGLTRLTFRDRAGRGQTRQYLLRLQTDLNDPVPENNQARILVGIEGTRPLLAATLSPEQSGLLRLLRRGALEVEGVDPRAFSWTLEALSDYAGVLLEDVPAETIGTAGMERLAAWVQQTGSGLLVTGGKNSFGPGGYYNSPLDPILPVSMELRQEHRDFRLALVIALDRSGSMSMAAGAGRSKMDLANLASVEVLELLSPNDELGVLAVDSSPHVISPCRPIRDQGNLKNDILHIDPGGGGIFVYTALVEAARMVSQAQAGTRHILLFADAADAEEPGRYEELLDACRQDGVTVSVIGLGKPTDADAEFLRDVARRGEGRIFFTEDARDLPRLFAQDTFVVARSTFIEDPTAFRFLPGMQALAETIPSDPPPVGGYNLCYLRPQANLAAVTQDSYRAPIIASWSAGLGRIAAYTGQADGPFTGPIGTWQQAADMFGSLARWIAGRPNELGEQLLVTQSVENGVCRIRAYLDPEREKMPFSTPPRVSSLRSRPDGTLQVEHTSLQWLDADTLECQIPLLGAETVLSTVDVEGLGRQSFSPVCLSYSPEYAPVTAAAGSRTLRQLARTTGGKDRIELEQIWRELPRRMQFLDLTRYFILAALVLFLVEILERRTGVFAQMTGLFSRRRRTRPAKAKTAAAPTAPTAPTAPITAAEQTDVPPIAAADAQASERRQASGKRRRRLSGLIRRRPAKQAPSADQAPLEPTDTPADMLDAFQQARRRARQRE